MTRVYTSPGIGGLVVYSDGELQAAGRCVKVRRFLATIALLHFLVFAVCLITPLDSSPENCEDSCPAKMANNEQTFIMIKPDGVARGLVGEIIKRFEAKVCPEWRN